MDFYQGTPSLSMTGGNTFTDISQDIEELNETVVFKAGAQTITGVKTFSVVPQCLLDPSNPDDLSTKSYVDTKVSKSGDENITGIKSFSSIPVCATQPTNNNQLANRAYVDTKVSKSGDENISGIKTFTSVPVCDTQPTNNNQLANMEYVDTKVSKSGDENISGIKTFTSVPVCATQPTDNNQLANREYVDNHLLGEYVDLTTNQTIAGNKTFSGTTTTSTTNINGGLTVTNNGAPSIRLNGNNTDGVYLTYYPDGSTRRAYLGFPGLGNVKFTINNEYSNGQLENLINGVVKSVTTTTTTTLTNTNNNITASTGSNTLTSAKTSAGANLLNATGTGGGNSMTTASGQNLISSGGGGSNLIQCIGGSARNTIYTTGTASNANFIDTFDGTGGNTIRASSGTNLISTATGLNKLLATGTVSSGAGNTLEVSAGDGGNVLRAIGTGTYGGGFNAIVGRNNYYDATPGGHLIRTGASGSEVNKITVYPTSTTLTNNSHTITATGNNILNTSAGENFMNVTAGNGSNVLQVTSTASGAGNKLLAGSSANGFNQISGYNNYYDVNSFGAHYIRVNGGDRIYVNGTNVNITNTNIDLIGNVYNYSPGGPSFNSIGSGAGGLYHTYYPDGFGAGRKAYVGYPGTLLTNFVIRNDYTNGSIDLSCYGTNTAINLDTVRIRKNNFEYPNIQVQWQTFGTTTDINQYQSFTNNYFSNGNFTVGEAEYIKFPFDTTCNWIMISFEAASFNGFTSRNLEIAFQSIGGTIYTVGETGPILGNADRAQYIQCNNQVLPFNTELRPLYKYTGTRIAGTWYGKQFSANFNFTQR